MSKVLARLRQIILMDPTENTRFFFSLGTIGYALVLPSFVGYPMYAMAFTWANPWLWSAAFLTNGIALLYGSITNTPTRLMYYLEGVLGAGAWFTLGLATTLAQGMPGPTFFASFVAIWIYVRYPEWH